MKLAAAVYLTLPGIPFIYYGEEIAMIGSGRMENKRHHAMDDGTHAGFSTRTPCTGEFQLCDFNVRDMQTDEASLWQLYRTLIAARNRYTALRRGDYLAMYRTNRIYAYARRTDDKSSSSCTISRHSDYQSRVDLSASKLSAVCDVRNLFPKQRRLGFD